jgi:Na+-transporting methylmalonyl-CoA/oxaloacetate decarboxylase gamma subunit
MNVYELVFLIVLVVTVGKLIERRVGRHHGRSKPADGASGGASAVRIDELEKRVQVLERIVTDQGYELRQKFRDLDD